MTYVKSPNLHSKTIQCRRTLFGRLAAGFTLVVCATAAWADSPVLKVTLAEAIEKALARNPSLSSALTGPAVAEGRESAARASLLPNLSASAAETRQSRPDVSTAGIGGAFGGGGLFATEVSTRRLALTQTILNLRDSSSARAAGELIQAAHGDADQAKLNLVADVKTAFYDLLYSGESRRVAAATVTQVERQLTQARQLVTAGTAPRLDELRAEVQLANVKSSLIRMEYQADIAREVLANLMAVDSSSPLQIEGQFLDVKPLEAREVLLKQAIEQRPDLRASRKRLSAARASLRAARAGHLPTVQFMAAYDQSQGQRFPIDQEVDIQSATVAVNLPLFDGNLTDGRKQEARALSRKAQHDLEALQQQVELDVTKSMSLVAQGVAVIQATQKAVEQAREALDIANEAYRVGSSTYLELLDAQLALAVADLNRAQARRDYSVSRAALDRALGLLQPSTLRLVSSESSKESAK